MYFDKFQKQSENFIIQATAPKIQIEDPLNFIPRISRLIKTSEEKLEEKNQKLICGFNKQCFILSGGLK